MPWQKTPLETELHFLIVEDEMADLELMVLALEQAGIAFTYDTADTLGDCQQLLQTQTYDAVLSDYQIPRSNGLQVLELVKQLGYEVPLILVTGNLGEEAAVECIKAGMTDYVLKDRLFRLPSVLVRSLEEFKLRRQQLAAMARIQRQAQQEAIINRIVQAMRGTLVLDEVLQTTVDQLHEALGVSRCLIFQFDSRNNSDQIEVQYVSKASTERVSIIGKSFGSHHHYREALSEGYPVAVSRIDASLPPDVQELANMFSVRSFMVTALLYQQTYLGGISLHQCDREREWTSEEIILVKAISDQCAIAIHQVQLFNQVQQQAVREQLLNQIGRSLNSSLNPKYVLQEIVKLTGECFNIDRVVIHRVDAEQIHVLNEWRLGGQVPSILNFKAPVTGWFDLLNHKSDSRRCQVLHAPNFGELPQTRGGVAQQQHATTLSLLCVPIFIREEFFGGLALHTTANYRTFTEDEIHLLQQIADQAAIALYNAQSYERLEQLVKERTQELEEEKLLSEAANRAKSEFLSNMSHELRTPLTGILGFSSALLEQIYGPLNEKQQKYLQVISNSGRHLLELINDLLDLSKIEAGRQELFLEIGLVEEVCQACISLIQERAQERGLQLSLSIAPDVTTCAADQLRLKQILVNLLSNAVKFTESGSVTLRVEQTEADIKFSVIDTGIGIAQADRATLFQPFRQLDGGLNRRYEGTGLGLALSRKLAQLHGGNITVESELGRGSCFTLQLPQGVGAGEAGGE